MMSLIQLAYVSQASSVITEEVAAEITRRAARKNTKLGIGGFLYFQNQSIFQVLEGEALAVRDLYARIAVDPRHHSVTLVRDLPIAATRFIAWGMTRLTACPRVLHKSMSCEIADPARCLVNRCHEREGFIDKIIAAGALIHDLAAVPGAEITDPTWP